MTLSGSRAPLIAIAIATSIAGCAPGRVDLDPGLEPFDEAEAPLGPEGDRFGVVTGGIYQGGDASLDTSADRILYEMQGGLGLGWVRVEAGWGGVGPRAIGRIVEKAHGLGMKVVVVVQPGLEGGTPDDGDIASYLDGRVRPLLEQGFVSNAAKPDLLEVGNELNGTRWNGNMAAWLTRRTKELLLRDPRFRGIGVVSAGTLNSYAREPGERDWFDAFFQSGAFRCTPDIESLYGCSGDQPIMPFDHFAVHPYNPYGSRLSNACINGGSADCFTTWRDETRLDLVHIRARLAGASGRVTELMVTEFGWQTPPGGWNQDCPDDPGTYHNCVRTEDQMRAAMQASYEALHDGNGQWLARAALWYGYRDDDPAGAGKHFGVRARDGAVKDAAWQKLRGLGGQPSWSDPQASWSGSRFSDVPSDHWAHAYIERLASDFIVDGRADRRFDPGAPVTRGEFATYLGRALTYRDESGPGRYCGWTLRDSDGSPFVDVAPSDPRFQRILTLVDAGVIEGYPDQTFRPESTLTRAQAAKMFTIALRWDSTAPDAATYGDVPVGHWAHGFVEAATAQGLFAGYADGTFRPNEPLTRGQIAKLLDVTFVEGGSCGEQ